MLTLLTLAAITKIGSYGVTRLRSKLWEKVLDCENGSSGFGLNVLADQLEKVFNGQRTHVFIATGPYRNGFCSLFFVACDKDKGNLLH